MLRAVVLALFVASCGAFAPSGAAVRGLARTGLDRVARAPIILRSEADEAAAAPAPAAEESVTEAAPRGGGRARAPRGKPLSEFAPEMVVDGEVKAVMKYGAFVDIGAASDGLVHISQLADTFVSDPTTIVSVGDKVTVRVLSIDEVKGQLALSMKEKSAGGGGRAPRRGPSRAARKQALEALVDSDPKEFIKGTVADIQSFGAFVTVEGGVDGLVHISRLSEEHVDNVADVLTVGDEVMVRVTEVDVENGKLALAMTPFVERDTSAPAAYTDDGYTPSSGARDGGRRGGGDDFGEGRPRTRRPRGGNDDKPQTLEEAFADRGGGRRIDSGLGKVVPSDLSEAGYAADFDWNGAITAWNAKNLETPSEQPLGQLYFDREEGTVKMAGMTKRQIDA